MRRQIAKLNHRVMAVELENQQAQQREMVRLLLVYLVSVVGRNGSTACLCEGWVIFFDYSFFQVLTVLCSAYFLVKAMVWLNKSF